MIRMGDLEFRAWGVWDGSDKSTEVVALDRSDRPGRRKVRWQFRQEGFGSRWLDRNPTSRR